MGSLSARRLVALQAIVSVVALSAVAWWAVRQPLPQLPALGDALPRLLGALALYALATALRAERWRFVLRRSGARLTRPDAYALTTVGYMGNNTLPARAGDVLKGVLSARETSTPTAGALGGLVAERLLDAAALGLLLVVLVALLPLPLGIPAWGIALIGAALLCVGLAAAALRAGGGHRLLALAATVLAPTRALWSPAGGGLLVMSIALWTVEGSIYALIGPIAGIHLSLLDGLYVMALANLVALVPAAPGYVGTYDAAVLLGVRLAGGGTRAAALGYVVLMRFVLFVPITLVGLVVLVTRYGGLGVVRSVVARPLAVTAQVAPPRPRSSLPEARSAA